MKVNTLTKQELEAAHQERIDALTAQRGLLTLDLQRAMDTLREIESVFLIPANLHIGPEAKLSHIQQKVRSALAALTSDKTALNETS